MAEPVSTYIQLPSDNLNTGKKNRTQTRSVGSNTVHEHYVVPSLDYTRNGRYIACSTAVQTVSSAAQNGTGSGAYWLSMSTAETHHGLLRRVEMQYSQEGVAAVFQSHPVFSLQKFTFNTAFTGTTLNVVKVQTGTTVQKSYLTSTSSSATVTLVGPVGQLLMPALISTVGAYGGHHVLLDTQETHNSGAVFHYEPGEGFVLFQLTSGNAADTRKWTAKFTFDEIDPT